MVRIGLAAVLALSAVGLGACAHKGSLADSSVRDVRVDGRLFEVRVAPTDVANEYRLMVVRATVVIDPDPELERERAQGVARRIMAQTCKGQYKPLEDELVDQINYYTRFRCL
jgi:hypothetical protein